tara:strand:+ start:2296 stop:2805 length:510 start_codon:yes stop_codon:yes gene_type:complete
MQILAGRYKGITIYTSRKIPYRPTKSRVRKSVFDKLQSFQFHSVLDLFAGSGIMGFEAASRGGSEITFIEKHTLAFLELKRNAKKFSYTEFNFKRANVLNTINRFGKYDLIFADPPYDTFNLEAMAKTILKHLNKNGKFILECEKSQRPFSDAEYADYGDTRILTWTNK